MYDRSVVVVYVCPARVSELWMVGIAGWSQGAGFTLEILLPAEMVPAAALTPARPRAAISRPLIFFFSLRGGGWLGLMMDVFSGLSLSLSLFDTKQQL